MRFKIGILMMLVSSNVFADGECRIKFIEISWRSDQQICDCSINGDLSQLLEPINGSCSIFKCKEVFPSDILTISDEDLKNMVCDVALKKIESETVSYCDTDVRCNDYGQLPAYINEVEDYDWGSKEKNDGTDRFHKVCTVRKERGCRPVCTNFTQESGPGGKKLEKKIPEVKPYIFKAPSDKEDWYQNFDPFVPGNQDPIFRDEKDTIG